MKEVTEKPFTDEQIALAAFAGALAHPARIAIITILQERGEASAGHIVEALPLAQATVSQHIKALNATGLLKSRNCGKKICYSINCETVKNFCHTFQCTLGTASEPAPVVESTCCNEDQI